MLPVSQNGWVSRKLWRNFEIISFEILRICDGKTCIKSRSLENLGVEFGMPGLYSMFKRQLQN